MLLEQIVVLAIVQGITEFLPISSSGHLILVPVLTGWADQGVLVDVMAHMGSFLAVLVYFRRDVAAMASGLARRLRGQPDAHGTLALLIAAATVPAVLFGIAVKATGLIDTVRGSEIVAWNAIIFAIVMVAADRFGKRRRTMMDVSFKTALLIGLAQAIALIPGVSRSGITISAARGLGLSRLEAARFSFLLGIPAIAGAGVLVLGEAIQSGESISGAALATAGLTFFAALAAIAFLMGIISRFGLAPFAIYRLGLGFMLLYLIHAGVIPA